MNKLPAKQKAFVEYYCGAAKFNAAEAARLAGYSVKTARTKGQQLLTKVDVQNHIENFQQTAAEKAQITVDDLLEELKENRAAAFEAGQVSAANQATMGKAKLLGLDVQKVDHTSSDGSMKAPSIIQLVTPNDNSQD